MGELKRAIHTAATPNGDGYLVNWRKWGFGFSIEFDDPAFLRLWIGPLRLGWKYGHFFRTKTGRILSEEEIQALSDEAERGYDVSHLMDQADVITFAWSEIEEEYTEAHGLTAFQDIQVLARAYRELKGKHRKAGSTRDKGREAHETGN